MLYQRGGRDSNQLGASSRDVKKRRDSASCTRRRAGNIMPYFKPLCLRLSFTWSKDLRCFCVSTEKSGKIMSLDPSKLRGSIFLLSRSTRSLSRKFKSLRINERRGVPEQPAFCEHILQQRMERRPSEEAARKGCRVGVL